MEFGEVLHNIQSNSTIKLARSIIENGLNYPKTTDFLEMLTDKLRLLLRVWKVYFAKRKNGLAAPGGGSCTPQLTRISHLAPQCQNLRLAIYIFHPLYGGQSLNQMTRSALCRRLKIYYILEMTNCPFIISYF